MSSTNNMININGDIENQLKYSIAKSDEQDNKSNDMGLCCMWCGIGLLSLAFIAGAICYFVFGIMFLVKDYNVAENCSGSNLWAYILTSIILGLLRSTAKTDKEDKSAIVCKLLILGLLETGLATWGGIELWNLSCDDLSKTNLWNFGLATFCIQIIAASLCLIIFPIVYYYVVFLPMLRSNNSER